MLGPPVIRVNASKSEGSVSSKSSAGGAAAAIGRKAWVPRTTFLGIIDLTVS